MHEGVTSTYLGMAGIPVITETIFLNRDIELLRYTGSRLHVTGISTEKGISMIREAKKEGLDITCSVTPYHLVLTDEALLTYDSLYKVKPVLRSETDRQALIEGLTDGTVDCIASHHRPQEWDSKAREFEYAGDGMNTQEIAVALVLDALQKKIPLERVIQILSIRPRQIFGLPSHIFSAGLSGGWTLFTTDDSTELTKERVQSASANNPFIGKKLKGRVIGIMNNHMLHLNH